MFIQVLVCYQETFKLAAVSLMKLIMVFVC